MSCVNTEARRGRGQQHRETGWGVKDRGRGSEENRENADWWTQFGLSCHNNSDDTAAMAIADWLAPGAEARKWCAERRRGINN